MNCLPCASDPPRPDCPFRGRISCLLCRAVVWNKPMLYRHQNAKHGMQRIHLRRTETGLVIVKMPRQRERFVQQPWA